MADMGFEEIESDTKNKKWSRTKTLPAGKTVAITLDGVVIASYTVPAGKETKVSISAMLAEKDA